MELFRPHPPNPYFDKLSTSLLQMEKGESDRINIMIIIIIFTIVSPLSMWRGAGGEV